MAAIGGSVESVTIAGREFAVSGDADITVKLGGFENEMQSNGNGTVRQIKSRVPHSVDGGTYEIDHARGDQEFLQNLADASEFFTFSITYVDGTTYQGRTQISGDFGYSTQNATATINFQGPQRLTKQ